MKRIVWLAIGAACLIASPALIAFAYEEHQSNIRSNERHAEMMREAWERRGMHYSGMETEWTNPLLFLMGMGVASGAAGLYCVFRGVRQRVGERAENPGPQA